MGAIFGNPIELKRYGGNTFTYLGFVLDTYPDPFVMLVHTFTADELANWSLNKVIVGGVDLANFDQGSVIAGDTLTVFATGAGHGHNHGDLVWNINGGTNHIFSSWTGGTSFYITLYLYMSTYPNIQWFPVVITNVGPY
jgi:hypothetical protein